MITTNDTKKALIAKLLEDKHITLGDAFMLLDEVEKPQGLGTPTVWPLISGPLGYWWYDSLGHAHWVPAGQLPPITVTTPVITWGTDGTLTTDLGTVSCSAGTVTDTVHYTQEQWDQMHRSGQISYTAGSTLIYSHLSPTGPVYIAN